MGLNHGVDSSVSARVLPVVERCSGFEQQPDDARKVAFRMALGDHATVNRKTKRCALVVRVASINRMAALEQKLHKFRNAAPGGIVQGLIPVVKLRRVDGKTQIQH